MHACGKRTSKRAGKTSVSESDVRPQLLEGMLKEIYFIGRIKFNIQGQRVSKMAAPAF